MNPKLKNTFLLLISVAIPLAIGFLGSLLTTPSINTWYTTLNKPSFNPPNWIFGPVWTTLFILMGVALFLILKEGKSVRHFKPACFSFGAQLFLNLYWSFLFFFAHAPSLAFWGIVSLMSMIIVNIYYFFQIKKVAAYLLIPYVLWVSFAASLNYLIWILN